MTPTTAPPNMQLNDLFYTEGGLFVVELEDEGSPRTVCMLFQVCDTDSYTSFHPKDLKAKKKKKNKKKTKKVLTEGQDSGNVYCSYP